MYEFFKNISAFSSSFLTEDFRKITSENSGQKTSIYDVHISQRFTPFGVIRLIHKVFKNDKKRCLSKFTFKTKKSFSKFTIHNAVKLNQFEFHHEVEILHSKMLLE